MLLLNLGAAEAGTEPAELCRRHAIADATFYNWRNKYGGQRYRN
ncbi:MAG: transposase [Deltaproteobacteria bacterium]|nr:transposase [Deltaproteobacteria bacterium]